MLNSAELSRYNRHLILPEFGIDGQEALKKGKVLMIGAGGLGCPVLQYLTAAGVGTLGILDFDKVDDSNLQRQILYTTEDIGKSKAEAAKARLSQLNPFVNFNIHTEKITSENALAIIQDYDVVVDGSDNFATRYLINDACVILKKPLVLGAIFKFEGQVSVFNYKDGPTYRCLFPEPPQPGEVPNCSEIGVIGVLPGIVGTLQANEVIKIITGIGDVLSGKFLTLNALTMDFRTFSFPTNPDNILIKELIDYEEFCGVNKKEDFIQELTVEELKEKIKTNHSFQLIDVREPYEHQAFNIGGELIPLKTLKENLSKVSLDKEVIVHCQSGARSLQAVKFISEQLGKKDIYNLKGGLKDWA